MTAPRRITVLLLLVALLGLTVPSGADDSIEDAQAQREEIRRQAAENAEQLDVTSAEDIEVVEALAQLDEWISFQTAKLDAARQELDVARQVEADAKERLRGLNTEIDDLSEALAAQSVEAYVLGTDIDDALLRAENPSEASYVQYLLSDARGVGLDLADILRAKKIEARQTREEAEQAREQAAELERQIATRVADLETSRAAQAEVKAELDARIAVLEDEAAQLSASDAAVTQLIQEYERQAAAEEAAAAEELNNPPAATPAPTAEPTATPAPGEPTAEPTATPAPGEPTAEPTVAPTAEPTAPPAPTPPPGGNPGFTWPCGGAVVSGFGNRVHPVLGTVRFHSGIDINCPNATAVGASAAGTVISAGWNGGYGNAVIIDHGGGFATLYGHLSEIDVAVGTAVSVGQLVGLVGSTGLSTGPHLHFEVRVNGTAVDPMGYL